jgi:tetratricopeptide (TPR) repeat protein
VPFALGYFPQLVRDVQQLWRMDWRQWKPSPATTSCSGLWEWGELMLAQKRPADALVAMAVLRVLGQTREARQLFRAIRGQAPSVWNVLLANEDGALAWQDGDFEAAARIWESITSEAPPIHFNRGLGTLLLGRTRQARDFLALAAARLPEVSPWHHLAHLYLLLTE